MSLLLNAIGQTVLFMGTAVVVLGAINYLLQERNR